MPMSSRELTHNLLTGKGDCDRVGLYEHFWVETPLTWVAQGYPTAKTATADDDGTLAGGEHLARVVHGSPSFVGEGQNIAPENPVRVFDYDMCPAGGMFDVDPISDGEEIIQETDTFIVKRNGAGAVFRYWKHKSGTPEHIDFTMTSREVWEQKYRSHLLELDPGRLETGSWKASTLGQDAAELAWGRANGKWTFFAHVCIWETMRGSLGDVCMFESLLLDPGWIRDFNRVYTDFYKAHFQLLFDTLGMPDGIWLYDDLGYRNGLFASPKVLQELIFPYYGELVDYFHALGLPVVLHSCGDVTQGLPLIVDAGFDALQPLEVKAGCDPFAFAEAYGDQLAFIGGLDVRYLESNDREIIEREVARLVEGMKARGARYFFHSDHSITPLVDFDSYRFALDVYRQHMMY